MCQKCIWEIADMHLGGVYPHALRAGFAPFTEYTFFICMFYVVHFFFLLNTIITICLKTSSDTSASLANFGSLHLLERAKDAFGRCASLRYAFGAVYPCALRGFFPPLQNTYLLCVFHVVFICTFYLVIIYVFSYPMPSSRHSFIPTQGEEKWIWYCDQWCSHAWYGWVQTAWAHWIGNGSACYQLVASVSCFISLIWLCCFV